MPKDHRNLLTRLEYRLSRFAIKNLMMIIIGGMAIIYIANLLVESILAQSLTNWLMFDRDAIFRGEVWRLLTFLLIPPESSPLFVFFALYLYYLYGKGLEQYWGTTRFNIFYFVGAIATLIVGLITGYATNSYLDSSIFIAFAILYPDFELRIFFILPIRVKWIALITVILDILMFLFGGWLLRIVLLVAYANILLFFWGDIIWHFRRITRNAEIRKQRQESRDRWKRK